MTIVSSERPIEPQFVSITLTGVPKEAGLPLPSSDVIAAILKRSLPPRSMTMKPRWSIRLYTGMPSGNR